MNLASATWRRWFVGGQSRRYFEEWDDPLISGIGWVLELIEIAGGEDVFPELRKQKAAKDRIVSPHDVIAAAPDVILAALVQTFGINATKRSGTLRGSCGENSIPHFGRPVVFDAKLSEFELTFPDPMHEFNAGDGDRGALKPLQSKHWTQTKFDRPVILLDQIVQIFRRSYLSPFAAPVFAEDFLRRPMGRLVAIKRDGARQSALALKRPPEKRFGCRDIPLGAE